MNNWHLQKIEINNTIVTKEYVKEHNNGSIEFILLKKFKHILKYNYYITYTKLNPISRYANDYSFDIYETSISYSSIQTKEEFELVFGIYEEHINTILDLYD